MNRIFEKDLCGAPVLSGVVIGNGSVAGANSVVARDAPPTIIVAGNPPRIIRKIKTKGASGAK